MRRALLTTIILFLLSAQAWADEIALTYRFAEPMLVEHVDGTVEPVLAGLNQFLVPGYPIVPAQTAWVALPQGHEVVAVRVEAAKARVVAQATAAWCPNFGPWGEPIEHEAQPNYDIYAGTAPYPSARFQPLSVQHKRGVAILPVVLYPVQYVPGNEELTFTSELTVRVTTRPQRRAEAELLPFRGLPDDLRELRARVDNPELLSRYEVETIPMRVEIDYLVITPQKWVNALQDYVQHKADLFGLRCEIVPLEDILAQMAGQTDQKKIRDYIVQRYNDGLQWVLIVGDADRDREVIKLRGLYVSGTDPDDGSTYTDSRMAADQYYGCLDGNYNQNGNNFWGEPNDGPGGGEVDLLYDVHVGRFAVEHLWEVKIMAGKTTAFEDDYQMPQRLLFVGEEADEVSSGGEMKDKVYEYCGDQTMPITRLYDYNNLFSHQHVVTAINSNQFQWLNHMGHADVTVNMTFYPSTVNELTNTRFYLGLSQGCYSGSVDSVSLYGQESVDCMAEQFTAKTQHAAFAYFMNTRYGFYLRGRLDGPSNVYDWEFADALFNDGIPNIGAAMDKGKEDCIGLLSPQNMMRWSWYTLFLFGDPQTPMRLNCDNDGDGYMSAYCGGLGEDCNDVDGAVNPDAAETCDDGVDNNCNGLADAEDPACAVADDDADDDAVDDDAVGDDDAAGDDDGADDDDNNDDGGCGC